MALADSSALALIRMRWTTSGDNNDPSCCRNDIWRAAIGQRAPKSNIRGAPLHCLLPIAAPKLVLSYSEAWNHSVKQASGKVCRASHQAMADGELPNGVTNSTEASRVSLTKVAGV